MLHLKTFHIGSMSFLCLYKLCLPKLLASINCNRFNKSLLINDKRFSHNIEFLKKIKYFYLVITYLVKKLIYQCTKYAVVY